MVTSLDRFINKTVIKRILFIINQSRLVENSFFGPVFEWLKQDGNLLKTGLKKHPENDRPKPDRPVFRC
jgi:hypothetical protein